MYYSIKIKNEKKTLTVILDKVYTIDDTDSRWDSVMRAIEELDTKKIESLLSVESRIKQYVELGGYSFTKQPCGHYNIVNDGMENIIISEKTFNYLINIVNFGMPILPYIRFVKNANQNPSCSAKEEILEFLEENSLPLTEDGCFIAYKGVQEDYYDVHSGRFRNKVGDVVEMERSEVCSDRNISCSTGLHFCSIRYINDHMFGERLMLIKVNPADVVSIPDDYGWGKGRCCKYVVVGEINPEQRHKINSEFVDKPIITKREIQSSKNQPVDIREFFEQVIETIGDIDFNRERYRENFKDTQYLKHYQNFTDFKKALKSYYNTEKK